MNLYFWLPDDPTDIACPVCGSETRLNFNSTQTLVECKCAFCGYWIGGATMPKRKSRSAVIKSAQVCLAGARKAITHRTHPAPTPELVKFAAERRAYLAKHCSRRADTPQDTSDRITERPPEFTKVHTYTVTIPSNVSAGTP